MKNIKLIFLGFGLLNIFLIRTMESQYQEEEYSNFLDQQNYQTDRQNESYDDGYEDIKDQILEMQLETLRFSQIESTSHPITEEPQKKKG